MPEMKAVEQTVLGVIGGLDKVYIIPPFQRNYEWAYEQCDELFYDIINAFKTKKVHYLGNIVYYPGKNNGASYGEFILVDGQQRVTTILLLLCAIRDVSKDDELKRKINNRFLVNDTCDERFRIRLKQTSYDSNAFVSIIDGTIKDNEFKDSNLVKNYRHFIRLLNNSDVSPKEIFETMPMLEVVDVNLKVNDLSTVQTVFEKINATGKKLTPADLIRNYLLLAESAEEQESLYKKYWVKIEETISNNNISKFARDYLIMNTYEDVVEDNIYKQFKGHFENSQATHCDILIDMNSLSKYYAWLRFENSPSDRINKIVKILNFLKTEDVYPLYLFLFSKLYENRQNELIMILNLLSDFLLRYRIVAPSGGGGALRSVVYQLLEKINLNEIDLTYDSIFFELSNSSAFSGRFPDDEEFKEELMKSVNINYARVLLLKIEEFETSNIDVPLEKVTVEHLMPQTLNEEWINYLGGQEEADRIYDRYLNCIGNLTPMSGRYNSRNSNKPWDKKLQILSEIQFLITSSICNTYSNWKEDDIKRRNKDVAERACKATISPLKRTRKCQTRNVSEEFIPGLYPLSDITTPMSNTRIQEILFDDNSVIKVNTWKDFFKTVCKIAYDYDTELFKRIADNNEIHKATSTKNYPYKDPIISTDPQKLVEAKQINNTRYYIEGCLSSMRARVFAKQLMDIYGITDAFQINVQ